MSNIVVLGADGFIGRHLVARLAEDPQNSVTGFDRFSRYKTSDEYSFPVHKKNISFVPGDFSNEADVENVLKGADTVFHFITTTTPASSDKDPLVDIDTNIKYSVRLFNLCVKAKVKKIIFPSSGGTVYGDIDSDSINELALPAPRSPYGIGKLTIENYLRYFKYNHGLDYIVYRISNPYGPGQNIHGQQGVVPIFMYKILHDEPLSIFGDGGMVRDYIYIKDLVEMIVQTYDRDNKYSEYNLGSGRGTSINELVDAMEAVTNRKIKRDKVDQPASFVQKSVMEITRFADEFGIRPTTSLKEGLKETWEYVQTIS